MSGYMESPFLLLFGIVAVGVLAAEEAVSAVDRLHRDIQRRAELRRANDAAAAVRSQLRELQASASSGLRATFGDEDRDARIWLASPVAETTDEPANLWKHVREGRRLAEVLSKAYGEKARDIGARQRADLAAFRGELESARDRFQRWHASLAVSNEDWQKRHDELRDLVGRQHHGKFGDQLTRYRKELGNCIEGVEKLEEQEQKRDYVIKALRQTVSDLFWREVDAPHLERPNDPASRVLYRVDTVTRGTIDFSIGLEKIESDSNILDSHCMDEFGRLSKHLQERFAVQTEFRPPRPLTPRARLGGRAKSQPGQKRGQREATVEDR